MQTAGTSEWSAFAVGSPSADVVARGGFCVRGLLPLRPTLSVDMVGSGARATVSACSATTVLLAFAFGSRLAALVRLPDVSEQIVDAERGGAVAMPASMAALARWTKPARLASCKVASKYAVGSSRPRIRDARTPGAFDWHTREADFDCAAIALDRTKDKSTKQIWRRDLEPICPRRF